MTAFAKFKRTILDTSLFRLCYLGVYFLYMITRLTNNIYMRSAVVILTLWGVAVAINSLIRNKSHFRIVYGFWLLGFILTFLITTVIHISGDMYAFGFNVFLLLQTFICFVLFYGMHSERSFLYRFEMYLIVRFFVYISVFALFIPTVFIVLLRFNKTCSKIL